MSRSPSNTHHAWWHRPPARKLIVLVVGIVIVSSAVTAVEGHGWTALYVIATALLAVLAEEAVRLALRYRFRPRYRFRAV